MKKIKVEKVIFSKSSYDRIKWNDIKHINFEDGDMIDMYEDDQDPDNYPTIYFKIIRLVEETDSEFEIRRLEFEKTQEKLKNNRYERYLELKKEFENG